MENVVFRDRFGETRSRTIYSALHEAVLGTVLPAVDQ